MSTFRTDIQGLWQRPANPFQVEHIAYLLAEYERAIAEGTRPLDAIQTFADALNEMLPDLLQAPAGRAEPRCQQVHQETGQCELKAGHEGSHLAGYIMWPTAGERTEKS